MHRAMHLAREKSKNIESVETRLHVSQVEGSLNMELALPRQTLYRSYLDGIEEYKAQGVKSYWFLDPENTMFLNE